MSMKKVDLETLLRESDFVSVHTDLNAQTQGMFNANLFQQMKKTAVFLNTARGPLVDQAALYGVLTKVRDLGLELLSVNRAVSESDAAFSGETPEAGGP